MLNTLQTECYSVSHLRTTEKNYSLGWKIFIVTGLMNIRRICSPAKSGINHKKRSEGRRGETPCPTLACSYPGNRMILPLIASSATFQGEVYYVRYPT